MPEKATEWFGMRVTPSQKEKIKRLADQKGTTQKAAVLDAVERHLAENGAEEESPSALELVEDLVGVEPDSDAPADLSTNPKHVEDYGKRLIRFWIPASSSVCSMRAINITSGLNGSSTASPPALLV